MARTTSGSAEPGEALLAGAGHDLAAEVEQHQQVTQVAGEEGHLVGAAQKGVLGARDPLHGGGHLVTVELARGLRHVHVVGRERRLELGLVDREERLGLERIAGGGTAVTGAAILLARRGLKLGESLEAEGLGKAHDRAARGVGAPRQLLRRVEGGLVEVVHDVLADILLRARELLEALADLRREGQGLSAGATHAGGIRPATGSSFRGPRHRGAMGLRGS